MKKTFKRILSSFLVAVIVLTAAPLSGFAGLKLPDWFSFAKIGEYIKAAAAANETFQYGIFICIEENNEITIKGVDKEINRKTYAGSIDIPEEINGKKVTKIGECAFKNFIGITSVYLPDNLTEVCGGAFFNCTSLSVVSMSPNLVNIGDLAFGKCTSLKAVILPSSLKKLGGGAFFQTSITSILIPASLEFCNIGYGVVGIGLGYRIGPFSSSKLKNIYFDSGCTKICQGLFMKCKELEEVNIPDSINKIECAAFYFCSNLKKVTGMVNVKEIREIVFCGCTSLSEINLPDGLTAIQGGAFSETSALKHINIPKSLTEVGAYASIVGIGTQYDLPPFDNSGLLYVKFDDGIKKIPAALLRRCEKLGMITLPESVETIEALAFSECSALPEVDLPSGIKTIEAGAFLNDKALKKISIPKSLVASSRSVSVVGIGSGTVGPFSGTSIKEATLENGIVNIPTALFYKCTKLEKIALPESVQGINSYAFNGCTVLESVHIPNSVSRIGTDSFGNCSELFFICSDSLESYAKTYAEKNNINFRICGDKVDFETYSLHAFASNADLYVGEKQTLNMQFELLGRDKSMRAACLADVAFAVTSSDNSVLSILSAENKSGYSKVSLFGERPGKVVLTVTAYRNDEYIKTSSFVIAVKGEQVYCVESLPKNDDFNVYSLGLTVDNFKYSSDSSAYNITFDVYNEAACFGTVEVYNKDGKIQQCIPIAKRNGMLPTGYWDLVKKAFNVTDLADRSYRNEAYSTKTSVEIDRMPRDGHIVVTNNAYSSVPCGVYNLSYLAVATIWPAIKNVAGGNKEKEVVEDAAKELTNELMKVIASQKSKIIINILNEFITTVQIGNAKQASEVVFEFIKCCGTLKIDMKQILMNSLVKMVKGLPVSLAEKTLTTLLGSAGQIIDFAFKMCEVANTINMMSDMRSLKKNQPINIYGRLSQRTLYSNGYSVSSDTAFDGGISFHQYKIVDTSKIDVVKKAFSDIRMLKVFGMSLYQDGKEVPIKGTVDVAIPVPKGMDIFAMKLYREEADGKYTEMKFDVKDGYIYFTTEHFSVYCITSNPITPQKLRFEKESIEMDIDKSFIQLPISDPEDISEDVKLIWQSSDENVAEITPNGFVISKSVGETIITVSTEDGSVSASYKIKVKEMAKVTDVSVSDVTLNYKKSTTIKPTIKADDGAKYTVEYSSSNTKVATVDDNGKVYGAKKGSATITCTVTDSNGNVATDTCKVTVGYSFGQWLIVIVLFGWIWY